MIPSTNGLKEKAKQIRLLVLEMIYRAKTSHIGTAFSCVDILTALYFGNVMRINPAEPFWLERDRFILSKGHGCSALYAALALRGFFSLKELEKFTTEGSCLSGHVTKDVLPGVETSGGSGGHGLSMGVGIALANKIDRGDCRRTFVLTGDGECQEGSFWEAVMFAGHHQLKNLVLIIDNNRLQIMGKTGEIVSVEPLKERLLAFQWEVAEVNGHRHSSLDWVLKIRSESPLAIIARTTKGKGVSFMENNPLWHGQCPNEEEYLKAKKEIEDAD